MNNLKDTRLHQIAAAIQSGSSRIRKDIFYRNNTICIGVMQTSA